MQKLAINDFKKMIAFALEKLRANADHFSALDAVTGDGDHGQAITTAFASVNDTVQNGKTFKTMLNDVGFNVMLTTSGSTSTLLGAFFLGMSDAVGDVEELDAGEVKAMFAGALENIKKNTKAVVGDKTMMDAVIPAVQAIEASASENIIEILDAGAEAAVKGADATVEMKANFGRARNYGERSIGSMDAGASSWSCMFKAYADALR